MNPQEFTRAILRANKGQCVVFDEAFTGLSSRASLTEINRVIVSLMMEMRQKNLFVIIVMPTFFLLDRYVALFRAVGLFHLYMKNGNRGYWIYFNNRKKKLLYLIGKKLFSYGKPKSNFRGRFVNKYTIDEPIYRKKKNESLMKKSRSTRAELLKQQRDILLWILNKDMKLNKVEISNLCKKNGFKIERNTISEIMMEMERTRKQEFPSQSNEVDYDEGAEATF